MVKEWNTLDSFDKADTLLEIGEGLLSHVVIPNIQKLALGNTLNSEALDKIKQSLDYVKECKLLCVDIKVNYDPDLLSVKSKVELRLNDLENLLLAFGV